MTPPEAGATGSDAGAPKPPAVSVCPVVMSRRADFLRAAQARRHATPGFTLQARERRDDTPAIRVGFTCSKKLGNAVTRNRAKRRLRAVVRQVLASAGLPGWDYVVVGRPGATVERDFALLLDDMGTALARVHGKGRAP
jgi:ribonuclease P protein component